GCTVAAGSVSCPSGTLASGAHTITVNVSDNAGNAGTGTGSFTVSTADTTAPVIGNVRPTGTLTTDSATIQVYYTETGSGISSASSWVYLDSIPMMGCTYTATVVNCPVDGLTNGTHTITGSIADVAGNRSSVPSSSFTVSISAKMNLQMQINGTMQLSGTQLTVPIRIRNTSGNQVKAYNIRLTQVTNSNGVTYTQPSLPLTFSSSLSGGSNSSTQNLTYNVPTGVTSFYTYYIVTASTASSGGTTYTYYLPLQLTGWSTGGD
ncbi:MAG: hypothetical protein ACYC6Z_06020, partial [Thermoleophilia bacterium]